MVFVLELRVSQVKSETPYRAAHFESRVNSLAFMNEFSQRRSRFRSAVLVRQYFFWLRSFSAASALSMDVSIPDDS